MPLGFMTWSATCGNGAQTTMALTAMASHRPQRTGDRRNAYCAWRSLVLKSTTLPPAHRQHNLPDLQRDSYGFRVMVAADGNWTGKLVIVKAEYGDLSSGAVNDVTKKMAGMVKNNTLSVVANNDFGDPVEGVHKQLKVDYTIDGKPLVKPSRKARAENSYRCQVIISVLTGFCFFSCPRSGV